MKTSKLTVLAAVMSLIKFNLRFLIYTLKNYRRLSDTSFVPKYTKVSDEDCQIFSKFILEHEKILVITGAGVSTESGIPDYRSEDVGLYARSNHKPVQYNEFLKSSYIRQRYWARNFIGWTRFSQFKPNFIHQSLADLEQAGKISCIITQNVDHLHSKAGSKNVIELHGTSYRVICLSCDNLILRHTFQETLVDLNPGIKCETTMIRPDGDVEISEEQIKHFQVPSCDKCKGILKPDIIFFGDNVPKKRVSQVQEEVSKADSLLVLGSSLSTFSGYRIILQAKEENKQIFIVNIGQTRADKDADIKISTKCGDILSRVMKLLNLNS